MRWVRAALAAVLLCLHGAAVHASLAAPENVSVRCGDHRPTVSWDYNSPQPHVFAVQLAGSERTFSVQTVERELDLRKFVWLSVEQIFGFHYITVTAEQDSNRSKTSRSPTFSYNKLKAVDVHCSLMFPPANLTAEGPQAKLTFGNPLYFYKELKALRDTQYEVKFTAATGNASHHDGKCKQERICESSVSVPEGAEPCVTLSGVITNGYQDIAVTSVGSVCAAERPLSEELLLGVAFAGVSILILVICVLVVFVCKTQAWSVSKTPTPQNLNPQSHSRPHAHRADTVYSQVQIIGPRSQTREDPHSTSPDSTEGRDESSVRNLAPDLAEDQVLIPDLHEDQDGSAESMQTETSSIHSSEDEIQVSNYERHNLLDINIDMSGEMVKGYTG